MALLPGWNELSSHDTHGAPYVDIRIYVVQISLFAPLLLALNCQRHFPAPSRPSMCGVHVQQIMHIIYRHTFALFCFSPVLWLRFSRDPLGGWAEGSEEVKRCLFALCRSVLRLNKSNHLAYMHKLVEQKAKLPLPTTAFLFLRRAGSMLKIIINLLKKSLPTTKKIKSTLQGYRHGFSRKRAQ